MRTKNLRPTMTTATITRKRTTDHRDQRCRVKNQFSWMVAVAVVLMMIAGDSPTSTNTMFLHTPLAVVEAFEMRAMSSSASTRGGVGIHGTAGSILRSSPDGIQVENTDVFEQMPLISPATGLKNEIYEWRLKQRIRYQCSGPSDGKPVVLVHGLFVNSDHWRYTLKELGEAGYRTYALDLLGYGYSDKPPINSEIARQINGENGRFHEEYEDLNDPELSQQEEQESVIRKIEQKMQSVLPDIELGAADGIAKRIRDVDLRHPVRGSPYNFYTWSELITDFVQDVVLQQDKQRKEQVTLICNSIGTMSSLQAVLDTPHIYNGVFCVSPNFRELHSAEVAFPQLSMPLIRLIQKTLRERGQSLFDTLAKPDIVKQILQEPYAVTDAVDDVLVEVLLNPLLLPGASNVVFDTLSYSAGPLPEQQLSMFPSGKPVWVGYGTADPWTPGKRVEALGQRFPNVVERVMAWDGIGHCPHDEAPQLVHPHVFDFLQRLYNNDNHNGKNDSSNTEIRDSVPKKDLYFANAASE